MNKTTIKRVLLPLCISVTLSVPALAGNIDRTQTASTKETTGFSLGLLMGALLGGPPGAIIGAASGGWLGHHDTQRTNTIADIRSDLVKRKNQITQLETELSATETELINTINRISSDSRLDTLEFLSKGLTTTVYFRSNEVALPIINANRLHQLAELLKDFPELHINMEGHADIRGDGEYNQHLSEFRIDTVQHLLEDAGIPANRIHCEAYGESRAMATEGDNENYVFDRRVSIHVSLMNS